MGLLSKIGKIFGRKESRTAGMMLAPTYGGAIWSDRRFDVFARETYMKNVIAFRSISEIAMSVATPPWKVYRWLSANDRENIDSHWLVDLVTHPNPKESWTRIMLRLAAFYALDGNVFGERVCPLAGKNVGLPKELYIHRPDRVQVLTEQATGKLVGYAKLANPVESKKRYDEMDVKGEIKRIPVNVKSQDGGRIVGYRYTVGGRNVDWEIDPLTGQCNLYHFKSFHPINDHWGAAPTESIAREIDTSNEATEWNKKMLEQEGRPGLAITIVGDMDDEQFEEYERRLKVHHSGVENVGANIVLVGERGTQVKPYAWSPAEMDFIKSNQELARRVSLGYGVPPMLLGIPGDNTYSNQKEARLAFWEGTILFYLRYFRDELNGWLIRRDGPDKDVFLDFVLDEIPALEPRREMMWERAQKANWLSINEKRALTSYESWGEHGDVILVPATQVPLGSFGSEEEEGRADEEAIARLIREQGITREEAEKLIGIDEEG